MKPFEKTSHHSRKISKSAAQGKMPGIHRRFQAVMQLMSNTYQLGIIIQSDYLHLSRSIVAMAGTYGNLYRGLSKITMTRDLLAQISLFPVNLALDRFSIKKKGNSQPAHRWGVTCLGDSYSSPPINTEIFIAVMKPPVSVSIGHGERSFVTALLPLK